MKPNVGFSKRSNGLEVVSGDLKVSPLVPFRSQQKIKLVQSAIQMKSTKGKVILTVELKTPALSLKRGYKGRF